MNEELKPILSIFHHAVDFKVVHSKSCLFCSRIKKKDLPEGIDKVSVCGNKGILLSTFKNNKREYCMIVNRRYDKDVKLTIKSKYYNIIDRGGKERPLDKNLTLLAGDCKILVKI